MSTCWLIHMSHQFFHSEELILLYTTWATLLHTCLLALCVCLGSQYIWTAVEYLLVLNRTRTNTYRVLATRACKEGLAHPLTIEIQLAIHVGSFPYRSIDGPRTTCIREYRLGDLCGIFDILLVGIIRGRSPCVKRHCDTSQRSTVALFTLQYSQQE